MANPRKFSEKIALHNHRQAEETAAFEQIMKEVNEVTTKDEVPLTSRTPSYRHEGRSRTRSQGGPIRRPHDRKLDTSPYSNSTCGTPGATYLSLPTDTGWRRTNSDSALHTSTMQGMVDRNNDVSRGWNMQMMNGPDRTLVDRPRSSCDIPLATRVPGISIHPSAHDPGPIQISIANTGSLPDLTTVDFSSPIHAPLDQDHDSSPYSSSPVNTSPSTLSPTSMPQGVRHPNRFHFPHTHSNHLSVPLSPRYQQQQQMRKNMQLDKNVVNLVDSDFAQLQELTNMYQHCPPTSPSPTLQSASYRSPRPSPQSSPSPGGGRHSAPCSPGAPSPLPNEYHILNQQAQFQQQFGQLSMLDTTPSTMSYVGDQSSVSSQQQQQQPSLMAQSPHSTPSLPEVSSIGNIELTSDGGYYSTSPSQQLVYPSTSPGVHTTTPNTPTSLPEIILTDFSGDDLSRQDSFSRSLASEFFSEETLKEGLGSLDFDEIQILANPSYPISEIVEDNFKLDHRS